ncbi:MAG: hypothetical protein M1830_006707, partial [Pleopsidium flavum]
MHADPFWASPVAAIRSPRAINLSPLTLSGSNLQQRLNYPVPPTPTSQPLDSSLSTSLPERGEALPLAVSLPPPTDLHVPVLPSAEQIVNLQNRYSRAQSRPMSRPVPVSYHRSSGYSAPTPPHAALGAAGGSTSLSGDPTLAPARTLSRSNSRGSTRSISLSTPNSQRPDYRRLDTIQSITSHISQHVHSRSASRDITISGVPKRVPSRAERSAAINVQAAKKSGRIGRQTGKKAKEKAGGGTDGQEWTDIEGQAGNSPKTQQNPLGALEL